jgi:hypothetical protein
MADYTLADLPYDYSALEPSISGTIMELHHDKHHKAYVDGANTAIAKLQEARDADDLGGVNKLQKDLAFNLAGHVNHTVFWNNLSPDGGDKPTGELAAAIDEFFGSFDKSVRTSRHPPWAFRGPAGRSSPGTRWARSSSSSSCTTTRATSRQPPFRFCCWTCGSTPSTSTTATSRLTT